MLGGLRAYVKPVRRRLSSERRLGWGLEGQRLDRCQHHASDTNVKLVSQERGRNHRRPLRHVNPYGYRRRRQHDALACSSVPCRNLWSLTAIARLNHGHMHGQDSHVTNAVRPFLGHKQTPRQSLTARRSRAADRSRERHVGRSECGSSHTWTPCSASLPSDRSVFETNRPGTGYHLLTICVEDIRLAIAGQRFLNRFDAEGRFHRDRQSPR